MTHTSAFNTPEGEVAYLAACDAAMKLWPVPYEETEIPSRFGTARCRQRPEGCPTVGALAWVLCYAGYVVT